MAVDLDDLTPEEQSAFREAALIRQGAEAQAQGSAYRERAILSEARNRKLLSRIAELEKRIAELEGRGELETAGDGG